jgi:hypothetical protein
MATPSTDRTFNVKILKVARREIGTIRATVDVQVGASLKILGCKVIQQQGQKAWVAMPAREWVDNSGQKNICRHGGAAREPQGGRRAGHSGGVGRG